MAKKRLVFCTYPSVYSSLVLKKLLADSEIDVVAIISSNRVLNKNFGFIQAALKQIQLSGWRYSTYLFFVTDLFAILSNLLPVKDKLPTVAKLAKKHYIPLLKTNDINNPGVCEYIVSQEPGFLLAAHFNQLIKPAVLEIANLTCLNIHPSLLPDYKGVDPVFYALLDNKQDIGVTVHRITESFDSGNILAQSFYPLNSYNTVFSHNCRLFSNGVELAIKCMKKQPVPEGQQQEPNKGSYDSWPDRTVIKHLRAKKIRLISLRHYFQKIMGF